MKVSFHIQRGRLARDEQTHEGPSQLQFRAFQPLWIAGLQAVQPGRLGDSLLFALRCRSLKALTGVGLFLNLGVCGSTRDAEGQLEAGASGAAVSRGWRPDAAFVSSAAGDASSVGHPVRRRRIRRW